MKNKSLLILCLFLTLSIAGCTQKPHMHNTEPVAGYEYVQSKFTYAPAKLLSKQDEEITINLKDLTGSPIESFEIAHEKLMHFVVVSKDLSYFVHIHPKYEGKGIFRITTQFPAGGEYALFADFVPKGQTLPVIKNDRVTVEGDPAAPNPTQLKPDKKLSKTIDGIVVSMGFDHIMAGMDLELVFSFKDATTGEPIKDLQPYLGAVGHVIIISENAQSYLHVHPMDEKSTGPTATFMANFPKSGLYKMWGQFQRNGKVITVPFTVEIP